MFKLMPDACQVDGLGELLASAREVTRETLRTKTWLTAAVACLQLRMNLKWSLRNSLAEIQ